MELYTVTLVAYAPELEDRIATAGLNSNVRFVDLHSPPPLLTAPTARVVSQYPEL